MIRTNPPPNRESETLSSDTLFTFTSHPMHLLDMMVNGVKPRYIYEKLPFVENNWCYIVAAKCFCDIPLSKIKAHLNWFGNYGLGITKAHLQSHGVSPVVYIHHNSHWILDVLMENQVTDLNSNPIVPYLKRYFGDDYRLSEDGSAKRSFRKFYDEREWRYIPNQEIQLLVDEEITIVQGLKLVKKKNHNRPFVSAKIDLTTDVIEYIIISSFMEYKEFKQSLRKIYIEDNDYELMLSKIICAERIIRDF